MNVNLSTYRVKTETEAIWHTVRQEVQTTTEVTSLFTPLTSSEEHNNDNSHMT